MVGDGGGRSGEGEAEAGEQAVQDAQGWRVAAGQIVPVHGQPSGAPIGAVLLEVQAACRAAGRQRLQQHFARRRVDARCLHDDLITGPYEASLTRLLGHVR